MKLTEQIERLERCAALLREVRDVAGEELPKFSSLHCIDDTASPPELCVYLNQYTQSKEDGFKELDRRAGFRALVHHFGIARVVPKYPEWFRFELDRNGPVALEIHNVPRPFKIECETVRNCVAVFADGRQMPLSEAEKLEAEAK